MGRKGIEKQRRGETLRHYSLRMGLPHLLKEWNTEKNLPLTPDDVFYGSKRKVWWRCEKGHEWEASLTCRSCGSGCHYCTGRKPVPGVNDLATLYPELAAQWHPLLNNELRPEDAKPGSDRKIWWRCEKGHEWQATIYSRVSGCACPYCEGRRVIPGENDFATLFPDMAMEWSARNGDLKPSELRPHSNRTVWWQCEKGHEWQTTVTARAKNRSGCPYCTNRKVLSGFNDLATLQPEIASQWHPTLNGKLTPNQVVAGSHKLAWWSCSEGHAWRTTISSPSANKYGCPICAGNTKKQWRAQYDKILAEANEKSPNNNVDFTVKLTG